MQCETYLIPKLCDYLKYWIATQISSDTHTQKKVEKKNRTFLLQVDIIFVVVVVKKIFTSHTYNRMAVTSGVFHPALNER